ncbi:hypothetical protein ACJ72_01176 [Emergomyces africanus]|uniref:Pre-mRNA-splicing factor n=1 Tax=Emergomyces africanus TaxID=1955775 RepID=A0A1B7P600_9EURO|nr:hypothetical protein ACJ72_01176 [Emergomyces africanus]
MSSDDANTNSKTKPFSISLSSSSQKKKPTSSITPTNGPSSASAKSTSEILPRRPRTFHDHDSDNEDNDHQAPIAEEVTGFDREAGGAISAHRRAEQEKQPLVIKVESKNNWQERPWQRKRRGLNLLPREIRAQREAEANAAAAAGGTSGPAVDVEGPSMKFGLSLAEKPEATGGQAGDIPMSDAGVPEEGKEEEGRQGEGEVPKKPLTQDDIALQAIIRESKVGGEETTRRSDLVIPGPGKRKERDEDEYGDEVYGAEAERFDETKSFRADVASRPDPAGLEAYNAIPVEEFGAALLRGMGWKDGEPIGRGKYGGSNASAKATTTGLKAHVPERRPGYLGIGAKELPGKDKGGSGSEIELGAWGKSAMRKAKKPGEGLYTPVLMRNKKTGELMTQEEFNRLAKGEGAGAVKKDGQDSWRERRDNNLQLNGRDRDRDRDKDRHSERAYYDGSESDVHKPRGSRSETRVDRDSARDRRNRYEDRKADTSDRGRDDRYHRDRESDRGDRDRGQGRRDRKQKDSGKSYNVDNDYRSRPSSSARDIIAIMLEIRIGIGIGPPQRIAEMIMMAARPGRVDHIVRKCIEKCTFRYPFKALVWFQGVRLDFLV